MGEERLKDGRRRNRMGVGRRKDGRRKKEGWEEEERKYEGWNRMEEGGKGWEIQNNNTASSNHPYSSVLRTVC